MTRQEAQDTFRKWISVWPVFLALVGFVWWGGTTLQAAQGRISILEERYSEQNKDIKEMRDCLVRIDKSLAVLVEQVNKR